MRSTTALLSLLSLLLLYPMAPDAKRRSPKLVTENLISVITPVHRAVADAHPWVNVRVQFGGTSDGRAADPASFKAQLGRCNITDRFEDFSSNGVTGKRARLPVALASKCRLKLTRKSKNRLKFKVRAADPPKRKARKYADRDQVRFGVREVANQLPIIEFLADPPLLGGGCGSAAPPACPAVEESVDVQFSAGASHDPDGDWLSFEWDFGDGSPPASGRSVTHRYATADEVMVTLRARDGPDEGGLVATVLRALPGGATLEAGRCAGLLRLSLAADTQSLDFGAVGLATTSAPRTFLVRNDDPPQDVTSQVAFSVEVATNDPATLDPTAFQIDTCRAGNPCRLDAGEEQPIAVTFSPTRDGHAQAVLEISATANNACSLRVLVHGYGGPGPGVPWGTPDTVVAQGDDLIAIPPDGVIIRIANTTGTCDGGTLDFAPCTLDRDCPGGRCLQSCIGGTSHGGGCSAPEHCPGGTCGEPFDATDLCTDGHGAVFLLSDDLHDDPDPNCELCHVTGTILRVGLDGSRAILTQDVTFESLAVACDRIADGRIYWTHFDVVVTSDDEIDLERLRSIRKNGSSPLTHIQNVNRRMGDVDPDTYIDPGSGFVFYEPTVALRVSHDGEIRYAANGFGLYRLDPSPLFISPDIDELLELADDGGIVTATTNQETGEVRVFKINPNNAVNGALSLASLTPWAVVRVPHNAGICGSPPCNLAVFVNDLVVDREGRVFINVGTRDATGAVPSTLRPRGTIRIDPTSDPAAGGVAGFVDLQTLSGLTR